MDSKAGFHGSAVCEIRRASMNDVITLNERLNPPAKLGRLEEVVAGMRK